jgi:predicted  nucleic acid-binding Zn-ribbon protein
MTMNVEAEIRDLKRRVGELEGSFGFLSEQIKGVHRDLHAFQASTEARFDRIEKDVTGVRAEVGSLRADVRSFRAHMPGIVANTMREVMRQRSGKSRKSSE